MNLELTQEEMVVVLDGLALLPLARSFNLFNRLMAQYQVSLQPKESESSPSSSGTVECVD